jgi:hypothetical protein
MFLRKLSWAQLTKGGVPPLFVLRPLHGGFTPPEVGAEYPAPDATDKFQMTRARQMYEQRRIGTRKQLDVGLDKSGGAPAKAAEKPAKARKEKGNGRG